MWTLNQLRTKVGGLRYNLCSIIEHKVQVCTFVHCLSNSGLLYPANRSTCALGLVAQSPTSSGSYTSSTTRFLHLGVISNWGPHNSLLWELPHALLDFSSICSLYPVDAKSKHIPQDITKMSSGSGKGEEFPPIDNHRSRISPQAPLRKKSQNSMEHSL